MTRHPPTPPHRAYQTSIEDDPAFDHLKKLSAEYWPLKRGDATTQQPSLDDLYERMWEEATAQTRKGWETRREGWTALVAEFVRCTPAYLAERASDGWEGDAAQAVREMQSSRTRSASGAWAQVELTAEERAELAELTRRADAYWRPADKAERLRQAMIAEVVRLVQDGRRQKIYGQTAAVARVTGWSRERCSRLARAATNPKQRGRHRAPAAV